MNQTAVEKERKMLEKSAGEFARKALLPERENNEKYPFGDFNTTPLEQAYDLGFFHAILPETLDGLGRAITPLCAILSSLCQIDASMGAIIFTNAVAQEVWLNAGAADLVAKATRSGNEAAVFITAFQTFTHPDEAGPLPKVRIDDGVYQICGNCDYVVLGGLASKAVLPGEVDGEDGFSYFLVDLTNDSVKKGEPVVSLGLRSCPAVDLALNDTPAVRIGDAGDGLRYFDMAVERLHPALAAMSVGVMKASFSEALAYCRKRIQGGRTIVQWSEVQMMLAQMAYRIDAAQTMVMQACQATDNRTPGWEKTSQTAVLHVQEVASEVVSDGLQLLGGYGYIKDYGQEKYLRDVKQLQAALGLAPMKKLRYLKKFYRL